jgi:hypothetical protein
MAYFAAHHARARAILTAAAGEVGHTITAGLLHVVAGEVETCEPDAVERAVSVSISASQPLTGHQNPLDGRDLRLSPLVVSVGYRLDDDGDLDAGVDASRLGGADRVSIEARASSDAAAILSAIGHQPSWAGLDPVVIDVAPSPSGWSVEQREDRAILTVPFEMITRAALPGAYGPAAT